MMLLATLPMTVRAGHSIPAALPAAGGYSTVVYARLLSDMTDVTANTDYEVSAFIGDECRAVGKTLTLSDDTKVLVFRIWGDVGMGGIDETGQTVNFIMHDRVSGKDYDITPEETITFRGDYTYGMPSAPVAFRFYLGQGIPIEELKVTKDHIIVYRSEIDIRERLDALITRLPVESKQTFHWELEQATVPDMLTFNDESGNINAISEGVATVVAVADADPAIRSTGVTVSVINPARTLITTGDNSLIVYMNGQETLDVTDDVNGLIYIGPSDYSSINVSYSSSDPSVVSTRHDEASSQQIFLAHKTGSSVITTSLTYLNCYTEADTTITLDITVYVALPLTGVSMSVTSMQVCRDSVAMLMLKAQPEGAVLTSENINLSIADTLIAQLGNYKVEDGATFIEIPIEGLFPGTTSILNAIHPEDVAKTIGGINVVVPLQLSEGWQWVTCYQPTAISGKTLEAAFGSSLNEVRSQSQNLFNDPDYGYIGSLYDSGLRQNECYKIHMAADASHVFEQPEGIMAPYAGGTINIEKQWTWFGNPYYCSHPIANYVSNAHEDDMIVALDAFAVFYDGEWNGSLEALRYGEAYMYYSEQGYTSLKLEAEGYVSDVPNDEENEEDYEEEDESEEEEDNLAPSHMKKESSRHRHSAFSPCDSRRFMDNMCMIATLGNGFSSMDNCQIGAFVGSDCRGTAYSKGGIFFLTVHGDAGEMVRMRLYDEDSDAYYDIKGTTELQPLVGSMRQPLLIHNDNNTLVLDINGAAQEDCYYTLQGIRLRQAPRKGIYIHKGRKVAVR